MAICGYDYGGEFLASVLAYEIDRIQMWIDAIPLQYHHASIQRVFCKYCKERTHLCGYCLDHKKNCCLLGGCDDRGNYPLDLSDIHILDARCRHFGLRWEGMMDRINDLHNDE
jgi:hypothetical protein